MLRNSLQPQSSHLIDIHLSTFLPLSLSSLSISPRSNNVIERNSFRCYCCCAAGSPTLPFETAHFSVRAALIGLPRSPGLGFFDRYRHKQSIPPHLTPLHNAF
ncbi:hypothetical protein BO85DRAFT_40470 [Aspergillus piperis CBS 112811]|uniref:Uncharacterized protein n=1 Tax=Aspergillus piperis CBS 112811 TaxID=1448313 RepID=A0A8G1VLS7_9EURO|nr:hypothetical protein BO85DRAFT_40470 [Aspergillus piperis CBS 112811]RAH56752.1 hypothetical protein BO85DRAFT_40470 [Aspergillus piperis CBS 112811]